MFIEPILGMDRPGVGGCADLGSNGIIGFQNKLTNNIKTSAIQ